jgi:hypothetical protein
MLTYVGKGYSEAFCANYDAIVLRLGAGEPILLVEGPDDICAPVRDTPDSHCRKESVTVRDLAAIDAVSELLGRRLEPGAELTLDASILTRMRDAFASGISRTGCGGCEWTELCNRIATADFAGARLQATR